MGLRKKEKRRELRSSGHIERIVDGGKDENNRTRTVFNKIILEIYSCVSLKAIPVQNWISG
jgi:hypothetical protein